MHTEKKPVEIGRNKTGWVICSHPDIKRLRMGDGSEDGDKEIIKKVNWI